jgi:hypothetical protein
MPLHRPHAFPPGFPAEGPLPAFPSPTYLAELGVTHLIGDRLLTGSRHAVQDVTQGITGDLRGAYDTWHMGGHLGEIGKTALEMEPGKGPSVAEEVQAVRRSAVMMATLGIADAVAGEYREGRNPGNSLAFFNGVEVALHTGVAPDATRNGPRRQAQQDAFLTAARTHDYLKLDDTQRDLLGEWFGAWATGWVEQLSLSGPNSERDPEQLLRIAQTMGAHAMDIARVAVLGAGKGGHAALPHLGAIGGLEEQGSYPLSAARRRIHTYQTELIRIHGAEAGLAKGDEMRVAAETERYEAMQPSLNTGRQRRVARTVTWFATKVGALHRIRQNLGDTQMQKRLEERVARMAQ